MNFKEFVSWCNNRACDGCWDAVTAIICADIIKDVRKNPFWKRERVWRKIHEENVMRDLILPLEERRKNVRN